MTSNKRFDPNQPTYWHECAEESEEDSEDEDGDLSNDPENLEIPDDLSSISDDVSIENDSGDEPDTSYGETEHTSDEEPPKR